MAKKYKQVADSHECQNSPMHQPLKSLSLISATVLLALVSPISLKATSLKISEVPAQAQTTQNRKAEADRLLAQGIKQQGAGQLEAALQSLQQALTIYKELQDRSGEGQVLKNLGNVYYAQKDYKKAIEFQQQALLLAREIRDRDLESRALNNLGAAYKELGDSPKAIEYYQQALAIAQEIQSRQSEQITLNNLGFIYTSLKKPAKAVEYYQQILAIARETKDRQSEGWAMNNIGWVYHQQRDYKQAFDYYQQALAVAQAIPNRQIQVKVLTNLGNAYSASGNYNKAIKYYQQLLAITREMQNHDLEWSTLTFIVNTYNYLKDYQKVIEFSQQALTLARETKNSEAEADALDTLTRAYNSLGDAQKILEFAQQALTLARKTQNHQWEAKALAVIGNAYFSLKDYHKAIEYYQQRLKIAREAKDRFREAAVSSALSSAYCLLRDYQKSLEYSQQALAIHQELKDYNSELSALHTLGANYIYLGDYQKAIELFQQELALARKIKNHDYEGSALAHLGFTYFAQGDSQKIIEYGQQALAVGRKNKSPMAEFISLLALSIGYGNLGNNEKGLEFSQAGLAIAKDPKVRQQLFSNSEELVLNVMGSLYRKLGRKEQAIDTYRETLVFDNRYFTAQVGLARTYRDLNMPITAITYYKQAISNIEQIRSEIHELDQQSQKSFLQAITVDTDRTRNADIYRELADLLLSQGRILEAQQVLELLKVQELRDYTKNTRAGGKNPEVGLNQTEEQIKKENGTLIAFGQRIYECQQTRCNQLSQLLDQREAVTEQFNQKVQTIEKQVRDRRSQDEAFLDPKKLGLKAKEIVEAQPGTVLIYPLVLDDKIWILWAAKGGIIKSVEVPKVGQKQLAETVLKFRQLLQTPSSNITELQATGKQLYDWLIKPIEPELKENKIQNLVFSLDRATRYIPMSALFDGEKYLIENYAVSTVLSADLTNTSDRIPPGTQNTSVLALGLSNAVAGFNSLPNVPAELDAIVRKQPNDTKGIYPGLEFLNQDFDWRSLRDNLLGHKLLHIATHGEFVPGSPDASYLLLGTGEKLAIPKIATLQDLGNVSLVVLSACETALAGPGQDGTEINGISYYFLNAGAKTVMASLWKVDDDSTSQLMQNFYGNLAKGTANAPITKAEALRHAQLNLLRGNSSTTDNFEQRSSLGAIPRIDSQTSSINSSVYEFSHPYYWAPFVLIGNSL